MNRSTAPIGPLRPSASRMQAPSQSRSWGHTREQISGTLVVDRERAAAPRGSLPPPPGRAIRGSGSRGGSLRCRAGSGTGCIGAPAPGRRPRRRPGRFHGSPGSGPAGRASAEPPARSGTRRTWGPTFLGMRRACAHHPGAEGRPPAPHFLARDGRFRHEAGAGQYPMAPGWVAEPLRGPIFESPNPQS